jgi:hypothetical protein
MKAMYKCISPADTIEDLPLQRSSWKIFKEVTLLLLACIPRVTFE